MKKPRTFKERLSTEPYYAILRRDANGKLFGYVEHGFYMSWSENSVRIWPYNSLCGSIIGFPDGTRHWSFSKKDATYAPDKTLSQWCGDDSAFIVRIGSKKCPIVIDIDQSDDTKYDYRNKSFSLSKKT